jgi:hypothetical protein
LSFDPFHNVVTVPMRGFRSRVLKSVLPTAVVLAGCGYLFAQAAGVYVATEKDDARRLTSELSWKLPFAFALWGGGITLVLEFLRHLWGGQKPAATPAEQSAPDAEQLLLQLLDQAEEAEARRSAVVAAPTARAVPVDPADPTPPPKFDPLPLPEIGLPAESAGR